jgi:hypothetical protein
MKRLRLQFIAIHALCVSVCRSHLRSIAFTPIDDRRAASGVAVVTITSWLDREVRARPCRAPLHRACDETCPLLIAMPTPRLAWYAG